MHALGQVDRTEVGGERAHQLHRLALRRLGQARGQRIHRFALLATADRKAADVFHLRKERGSALFGQQFADQCAQRAHIVAQQVVAGDELQSLAQGIVGGRHRRRLAWIGATQQSKLQA